MQSPSNWPLECTDFLIKLVTYFKITRNNTFASENKLCYLVLPSYQCICLSKHFYFQENCFQNWNICYLKVYFNICFLQKLITAGYQLLERDIWWKILSSIVALDRWYKYKPLVQLFLQQKHVTCISHVSIKKTYLFALDIQNIWKTLNCCTINLFCLII